MNVTKCVNGHFFDADKYQLCPHCGAASASGNQQKVEQPKKQHGTSKKKKDIEKVGMRKVPDKTMGKTFGIFHQDQSKLTPEQPKGTVQPSIRQNTPQPVEQENEVIFQKSEPVAEPVAPRPIPAPQPEAAPSISAAVKNVSSTSEGKTVGFFSMGNHASPSATEPVVGWIVCVKGEHFGESFGIFAGRNAVGRGSENKIVLHKDNSVSREKHAWITYEPKKREFFLQPGEGSGLSYLNGENVMESKKMSMYDKLEFGKGTYILIPLCGEHFTWEAYMGEE